jgi:acetylornithine deacetylase
MVDTKELLEDLVGFDTVSDKPTIQMFNYVAGILYNLGFDVIKTEEGLYVSLIAKNKLAEEYEKQGKKYIGLCGHMDTVPFNREEWETNPLKLIEKDNKLYGLGSADMKGPIACMLKAIEDTKDKVPVGLVLTHSEEIGLLGSNELMKTNPELMQNMNIVIGEPTNFNLAYTHKGFIMYNITIKGEAKHSSNPKLGLNVIYGATDLIKKIESLNNELMSQKTDDFEFGSTTSLGMIGGGSVYNKVCDNVTIKGDLRLVPGKTKEMFKNMLSREFKLLELQGYKVDYEIITDNPSFYQDPNSDFIKNLAKLTGKTPSSVNYATDAAYLSQSCNCAIIGPGDIDVCHQSNEFIPVEDLDKGVKLYKDILTNQT